MSNSPQTSAGPQRSGQQGTGITTPQQFVLTFVGWLILQILSPEEWQSVIGTFLTVESTVLFLLSAIQQKRLPSNSTIQFLLAAYIGYFIVYQSGSGSRQSSSSRKSPNPKPPSMVKVVTRKR